MTAEYDLPTRERKEQYMELQLALFPFCLDTVDYQKQLMAKETYLVIGTENVPPLVLHNISPLCKL